MEQWKELGLYDADLPGFPAAFKQTLTRTLARGGRIHFNLDDLDVGRALAGNPDEWMERWTAWELQQIVRNPSWFKSTTFYQGGRALNTHEVESLGISLVRQ